MAVSFLLAASFSAGARWPKAGDFLQTLNRWLMGEQTPPGIGLRHELNGTELTVDLFYDDDEWRERFAARAPRIVLSRGEGGADRSELTWERLAPGHYSVRTELKEGEPVRGAVQVGGTALPFGPVVAGGSAEWAFDRERVAELRSVAKLSGGRELLDLREAWKKPERRDFAGIQGWLLTLLLGIVLAEALVTRAGWRMPEFAGWRKRAARRRIGKRKSEKPVTVADVGETSVDKEVGTETPPMGIQTPTPAQSQTPPPEKSAEEKVQERKSRFSRAKRGK
ncbi:MAG: hypothetical protein H7A53_06065 [Akkermansiaceae bacterium]|nr:hypothetical protein [Akkermansiaceae bacterium]